MEQAGPVTNRERLLVFILAAIQFAHIVDFVVMMPLGPTLMDLFHITPGQFSALVSSYNLSAGLSGLLFSTTADKYDRKSLLLLTLIGFIIGTLACGLGSTFHELLMGRIITGACGGVLNSLVLTMASDLVPFVRRGKAMSTIMSAFSFASVMGVPLGLTLADKFGWSWAFYFIVMLGIIVFILAIKNFSNMTDHISHGSQLSGIQTIISAVRSPSYLQAHLLIFNVSLSMFLVIPFVGPFAVKNVGIHTHHLKYMYLCGGLVTIFTARLIGKWTDKIGPYKAFAILAFFSSVPVAVYTHATQMSLQWFLLLTTIFMAIVSGRMIPCMTMVSAVADHRDRASFMAVLNSIRALGSAIAGMISGMMIGENHELDILVGFNHVGNLSIVLIFVSIFSARYLHTKMLARSGKNIQPVEMHS